MSITKTLLAGVAGTVLLSAGAIAAEPLKLTDAQLDDVTAGFGSVNSFGGFSDTVGFGFGVFSFEGVAVAESKDSVDIPATPPMGLAFKQEGFAFASLAAGFGPVNGVSLGGISAPGLPFGGNGGLYTTYAVSSSLPAFFD